MIDNNFSTLTSSITEKPIAKFFENGAIVSLAHHLKPLMLISLEKALGKSVHPRYSDSFQHIDTMYAIVQKRYFPSFPINKEKSSKENFQEMITNLLQKFKNQQLLYSASTFLKEFEGRLGTLIEEKDCPGEDTKPGWRHALQTAAAFFSFNHDYPKLERLFQTHEETLLTATKKRDLAMVHLLLEHAEQETSLSCKQEVLAILQRNGHLESEIYFVKLLMNRPIRTKGKRPAEKQATATDRIKVKCLNK